MKKKIFTILLIIITVISTFPLSTSAASSPITSCVDLTGLDNNTFGKGYEWDNLHCILILTDMNLNTADSCGIKLPSGSTIILNGESSVTANLYGIECLGGLTVKGEGSLTITATQIGISALSSQEKHSIVFREGTVTVNGAKNGIYAENSELTFSGAKIKITATENALFGKNIKAVSGSLELIGKIKAKGALTVSNTALSVSAADKALDAAQGFTFNDVKLSTGDTPSTLKEVSDYNGEKAVKTVGTRKDIKYGFLFGGKLPAFVDYIVIALIASAVAAVIAVPIIIKKKKTATLIALSEAKNKRKNKKK